MNKILMTNTLSAIPIREPYIDMILAGAKIWEIRSKFTKKIGPVALIRSGSGTVVATANLVEVIKLTADLAYNNLNNMCIKSMPREKANSFEGKYAWVLKDVIKLNTPIPYKHPSGAVTWVTLDEPTTKKVLDEANRSPKVKNMPHIS
jgi:hypothetical protein